MTVCRRNYQEGEKTEKATEYQHFFRFHNLDILPGLLAGTVIFRKEVSQIATTPKLPEPCSAGYGILALTAICGELPADQLHRLPGGDSYKSKVIQSLKSQKLLRTFYRDSLRGYRLTQAAKSLLCDASPQRFSFALTGAAETNHIKSEITRRLRLHRIAEATITMMNAGVRLHRDEKPDIFAPTWEHGVRPFLSAPVFYNSREIKEMGTVFVKIHGARSVGVLLSPTQIFVVYNFGDGLMKWDYKSEMRTKALMKTVLCNNRLSHLYTPDSVSGLLLGNNLSLAYDILTGQARSQYFLLDGNYEHFYFLTNDRHGERLLQLLCSSELTNQMEDILLADLYEGNESSTLENDAFDEAGDPVLLGYTLDLPRIKRFNTALHLQGRSGTLICFDYQKEFLQRYCCNRVRFQTIDFQKWERSFFE